MLTTEERLDAAVEKLLSLPEDVLNTRNTPFMEKTIEEARRWKAAREAGIV